MTMKPKKTRKLKKNAGGSAPEKKSLENHNPLLAERLERRVGEDLEIKTKRLQRKEGGGRGTPGEKLSI